MLILSNFWFIFASAIVPNNELTLCIMRLKDYFLDEFRTSPLECCLVLVLIFSLLVFTLVGAFAVCVKVYLQLTLDALTLKVV